MTRLIIGKKFAQILSKSSLDPGAFYILVSQEAVTIPPDYAAEMAPYLAMVGEFRVHYAGFFDPGFRPCCREWSGQQRRSGSPLP